MDLFQFLLFLGVISLLFTKVLPYIELPILLFISGRFRLGEYGAIKFVEAYFVISGLMSKTGCYF